MGQFDQGKNSLTFFALGCLALTGGVAVSLLLAGRMGRRFSAVLPSSSPPPGFWSVERINLWFECGHH
ncbi:hypothetical protein [Streptomyces sudanensis]|uniref:hypothetical protein n=1 Tax=Streptomyces sudanensis TaxID=436397 RepID=UPI0020CE785B|nr:hypothetical protein [Streptomyces sudanensis]MCP9956882.1 hypothetical protein [Streptomyces sudanensis]